MRIVRIAVSTSAMARCRVPAVIVGYVLCILTQMCLGGACRNTNEIAHGGLGESDMKSQGGHDRLSLSGDGLDSSRRLWLHEGLAVVQQNQAATAARKRTE